MNVLDGVFRKWWPDLLQQINAIKAQASSSPQPQKRSTESILEEILTLVRGLGSGTRFAPKELLAMDLARQQTMHAIAVAAVEEMTLSAMNIRPAIVEMLEAARINTLGDLLKKSEDELSRLSPAMGLKALDEIKEALAIHGLALKKPES
jgi:DNA-directed RNA polymerase alpha subunit